ncbi:MAG TPA: hypothetical protein PKK74_09985 [Candidatus Methanoculleus thermohydrogenotrophicum]|nr:hypothetical protein [Candidatus Methanoculleus thermohydrogenotrophicum]HOB18998.1 hypothetical protein [Candidatus Methanoculleus thermohydrogenotrophicum]HPZ39024.1 hypothetical protein [Candidatus Methanoculleus thermohydrogenotrophicum]
MTNFITITLAGIDAMAKGRTLVYAVNNKGVTYVILARFRRKK